VIEVLAQSSSEVSVGARVQMIDAGNLPSSQIQYPFGDLKTENCFQAHEKFEERAYPL